MTQIKRYLLQCHHHFQFTLQDFWQIFLCYSLFGFFHTTHEEILKTFNGDCLTQTLYESYLSVNQLQQMKVSLRQAMKQEKVEQMESMRTRVKTLWPMLNFRTTWLFNTWHCCYCYLNLVCKAYGFFFHSLEVVKGSEPNKKIRD